MEPGSYTAKATDVQLGFSGNGTPQIAVLFTVSDGPCSGQSITWYGYFTDKTQERTVESLRHCGWKGVDLSEVTAHSLPDKAQIVVQLDTDYDGNPRKRVAWVNRIGGTVALRHSMTESQRKHFGAKMRGLCMRVGGSGGSGGGSDGARSAQPPGELPPDYEIPF